MMKKKTTAMMMRMMSTVMTWTAVMVIRTSGVATLAGVDNNIVDNIDCNKSGTGICNSNINATSSITENTASSISGNLDKLGNGKARHNTSVVGSSEEVMLMKDRGTSTVQNPSNAPMSTAERMGAYITPNICS